MIGVGGVVGALIGSSLSSVWLTDMRLFKPVFALLVFFIAAQIAWRLLRKSTADDEVSNTLRAADTFMRYVKSGGEACDIGVTHQHLSWSRVVIEFGKEVFVFHPMLPFFTGMGIALLSSALGVGGGFLLVPFMSVVLRLPMYVIAGTSALAIT
ncbi:MAG: sulfite exporter TauE/SafE family protein, partial [Gammaproteobacteria bacterium]|nr:sulfite exporter TauE/SafE family protein [Gammaproteobacteria bacterium]